MKTFLISLSLLSSSALFAEVSPLTYSCRIIVGAPLPKRPTITTKTITFDNEDLAKSYVAKDLVSANKFDYKLAFTNLALNGGNSSVDLMKYDQEGMVKISVNATNGISFNDSSESHSIGDGKTVSIDCEAQSQN